jgi:amidase
MDRRQFIGSTAVGTVGLALGSACTVRPQDEAAGGGPAEVGPFELEEVDVAELQGSMEAGERSARSITEAYLARTEQLNLLGPELRAVIETNPDAREIAEELDAERAADGPRGPLHGIPVLVKDNIDTADRMTTTAGSLALEGSIPPRDSFIVQRLREAGAVVLGKANLSEWANFRGSRSTSGWSARGGQCRNPYALDRNPCGSSSGSGVAASANLTALAIGTETNGSIMCPSSINGIVGLKPTVGLWSRSGIIPISHTQDTAGPMCRTVRDAAVLLGPLTGVDPRDPATAASEGNAHADYTLFLDPAGLEGARIGVARDVLGSHPEVYALFDAAVEVMREQGAVIVDPANLGQEVYEPAQQIVTLEYEFKANLDAYLAELGPAAPVRTLADIIDFNERNADLEMPHFGQELMVSSQERGALTDSEYRSALAAIQGATRGGIVGLMSEHELDAIVAPSTPVAWLTDHIKGDRPDGAHSSGAAAIAGYPSITVPMGFVSGLPVGMTFFAGPWAEPTLLRNAYAYEQATRHRRTPTFPETVG